MKLHKVLDTRAATHTVARRPAYFKDAEGALWPFGRDAVPQMFGCLVESSSGWGREQVGFSGAPGLQ